MLTDQFCSNPTMMYDNIVINPEHIAYLHISFIFIAGRAHSVYAVHSACWAQTVHAKQLCKREITLSEFLTKSLKDTITWQLTAMLRHYRRKWKPYLIKSWFTLTPLNPPSPTPPVHIQRKNKSKTLWSQYQYLAHLSIK